VFYFINIIYFDIYLSIDPYNWSTVAKNWVTQLVPDQITIGCLSRSFDDLQANLGNNNNNNNKMFIFIFNFIVDFFNVPYVQNLSHI